MKKKETWVVKKHEGLFAVIERRVKFLGKFITIREVTYDGGNQWW